MTINPLHDRASAVIGPLLRHAGKIVTCVSLHPHPTTCAIAISLYHTRRDKQNIDMHEVNIMMTETETEDIPVAPAAAAPTTICEECKVHEATQQRIQIIVDSVLKAVRYCSVCQEKYFEKLPLNRAQRRQIMKQMRLTMKHEARADSAQLQRRAKRAA